MKITVDVPDAELREICDITGIRKKGPAIRRLIADSLQLRKRAQVAARFLSGEWSADLDSFEATRTADRRGAQTLSEAWRD